MIEQPKLEIEKTNESEYVDIGNITAKWGCCSRGRIIMELKFEEK